jgi:CRISPR/Cas system Type II protein with McrA/HNH and RuvC-like nuclease domain
MSIKAKSTAVAIATVSTVLSFSVPSQAGEYGYLYELETMAKQHDVKSNSDNLSVSEKLEDGKEYCNFLKYKSIEDIYSLIQGISYYSLFIQIQKEPSKQKIDDIIKFTLVKFDASVKELCPEYKDKFNNFLSQYSEN